MNVLAQHSATFDVPRCAPARVVIKDLAGRPLALVGLILLLPLLLVVAALVKLSSPGPVFHRRRVLGQYGRPFDAFKFRTMVVDADTWLDLDPELRAQYVVNHKLVDDPRVTTIGRFLRKYSLDEFPQLWNVVRGDMWLVGPRMIAPDELEKYDRLAGKLLSVKPGITGLWQVSGRQTTSYQRRVELDMHYIDHWSIATDAAILVRTVGVIVKATGAY